MKYEPFEILIIGNGINGAGIARGAVGSGFPMYLREAIGLPSEISSATPGPIAGGLRYPEQYEIGFVGKAPEQPRALFHFAPWELSGSAA